MNTIALYEEWVKFESNLDYSPSSIDYRVNYMNIWGKLGIERRELLKEGCMPGFTLHEFRERLIPDLNESKDYDTILDAYSLYELNLLKTEKSDWFTDDAKILVIPNYSEGKVILSKNESFFIISTNTWHIVNENWFGDMVEKGKKLAGDVWNTLKQGAQEVYGFLASLATDIAKFASAEPISAAALTLNILAGIISFVPAVGQIAAPILTAISGGIEIVGGMGKIKKGYKAISQVDDPIVKSMVAIGEGAPLIVVGGVTMFLGLSDIITSVKDATPGAAGIAASTKTAAKKTAEKMHHTLLGKAEGEFVKIVGNLVKKKVTSPSVVGNVTKSATAIGLILIVKGIKFALGKLGDIIVEGLGLVGKGLDFLINIPSKISELIDKISSDNSSTAVKLIAGALKGGVKPITDAMSKFINSFVKPISEPITNWLKSLPSQYKMAKEEIEKNLKGVPDEPVEIKNRKVEQKEIKISSEDKKAIEKLQKSGKKNESVLPFDEWTNLGLI